MYGEVDRSVVMRSPCAGAALDPPLWIVPNKALSLAPSFTAAMNEADAGRDRATPASKELGGGRRDEGFIRAKR